MEMHLKIHLDLHHMLEDPTKIENQEMFYKKKRKGNTLIHPL
jgi:hypothetical protein